MWRRGGSWAMLTNPPLPAAIDRQHISILALTYCSVNADEHAAASKLQLNNTSFHVSLQLYCSCTASLTLTHVALLAVYRLTRQQLPNV